MTTDVYVDIDELAESLGIGTSDLKARLEFLATVQVVREAARLQHPELFGSNAEKTQMQPDLDIKHENLVAACRAILPEVEEFTEGD